MHIVFLAPFGLQPKMTVRARALPLAEALAVRGHRVTLLVPPWDDRGAGGRREVGERVHIVHLPLPADARWDLPLLTTRMLSAALRLRPDLVHGWKPKGYSGLVAAAWWQLHRLGAVRAPLVMDTDDWEGPGGWNERGGYSPAQQAFFAWQERWGLTHAHGVTVASRALESLTWALGVPQVQTCYLPNGPREWPSPEPLAVSALRGKLGLDGHPTALLYTRFWEFDPMRLAAAWAQVIGALPAARLLVIGQGLAGEEVAFRAAFEAQGVAHTLVECGWLSPADLPTHWALASVGLYPMDDTLLNRTKCPAKLTDLLGSGLPVVGERVGQVAEYLALGGGALVASGDVDAFATATLALLTDPARAAAEGDRGRRALSAAWSWPRLASQVEDFYARLISIHASR